MKFKLKLTDAGVVELRDGKPVYVDESGKEFVFDASEMYGKITALNGENQKHRERAETAEAKVAAFGDLDVEAARKAINTVKNLDDKKLVDAGEVEKVKAEAIKASRAEFEPVVTERDSLRAQLHSEKIGGSFARSKYITDKLAIPPDFAEARFGSHFKLEGNSIVAYDVDGKNKLFSRQRPGELADFDEALELLVERYPHKDRILKSTNANGGGTQNGGGNNAGAKTITRSAFDALSPAAKSDAIRQGHTVVD